MSGAKGRPRGINPPATLSLPPLFRKIDWLTFLVTFAAVGVGYYLTLAPELTLEDSGELATGSFYAGIPHPPGYPVWTIYTWLWTVLLPLKNVAWRVALGEATGGALAAGLLGMLVSRGSSLLMEGIEEFRTVQGRWEGAICMVSGFVAGMLLGYNGYMWSQSVIVEVYSFSLASFMVVLLCLLRWIYAPHERRFLYYALFFHGLCFTNHQTLIVAAMGIEVAIAATDFRLGRCLFLGNSIIYLAGLILKQQHVLTALEQNQAVFVIFNVVGVCSLAAYAWFAILTKETFTEFCLDACQAAFFLLLAAAPAVGWPACLLAAGALGGFVKFARDTRKLGTEWAVVIFCGLAWVLGAAFYFYMPLAGMTNPPMEWGYPRTVEGFVHAFTRGQYEKTHPSDVFNDPGNFLMQLKNLGLGIVDEFNWIYSLLALVPFLFFRKMQRRERAWLVGITAIYLCLGVLLLILLNPPADRAAQELNRVFFTASHTLIALLVGYGLTLVAACMATRYQAFRRWGLVGGGVAVALAFYSFTELIEKTFFGEGAAISLSTLASFVVQAFTNEDQFALPVYAGLMLIGMAAAYLAAVALYRHRAPLAIILGIFALMPLYSIMTHWSDNEQHNHWFGYWFGHDMFTPPFKGADNKPLYPEMAKNAVLFGGTDPGRFCPTYMIFCDSFIPHPCPPSEDRHFDRRDVYIITQNALADDTYLCYIRAQYDRSTQIDPPFFQELFRPQKERQQNYKTNLLARTVAPLDRLFGGLGDRVEEHRRTYTSWFAGKDFIDLPAFTARLRPGGQQDPLSKYLYDHLRPQTQALLSSPGEPARLRQGLADDLNRLLERELIIKQHLLAKAREKAAVNQEIADGNSSGRLRQKQQQLAADISELSRPSSLYEPERFRQVQLSEYLAGFIQQYPQSWTRIRLNRLLLEAAYPKEIAASPGGVYPDREIYTPTPKDLERCYSEYLSDAARRLELKQLEPGEDVRYVGDKVQISGQVAVMKINGLLTKVIFDQNPNSEFFVEESFPLKWMYRHLTPFGIIMKLNRQPLPEISADAVRKDHEFWTQYSERLIGNWITYDTSVKDIAAFVERVYLRRNLRGFKGDPRFVRDDQAQKAFSKLRGSTAGLYAWRINDPDNQNPVARQRMIKEADFAFRQSFAFCPYSPEAVFRYVNFLMSQNRLDDALLIAATCRKLDPYNRQAIEVVNDLEAIRKRQTRANPNPSSFAQMEQAVQDHPTNFQAAFDLASAYLQAQDTSRALVVLDRVLNHPLAEANAYRALLQAYASIANLDGLQRTVAKLEALARANPTNFQAAIGLAEGYQHLKKTDAAIRILDQIVRHPQADGSSMLRAAQLYASMNNYQGFELALDRLTKLSPGNLDAWYDLAALKASLGKPQEAMPALRQALGLNAKRLQQDPKARDLCAEARQDPRFSSLRQSPEFKELTTPK